MPQPSVTNGEITRSAASIRVPGFVGREHEVTALTRALGGAPAVILVEGEAGIGKTRLITEFLSSNQRRRAKALVACCPPLRTPCTLGPVVDAVRQAVDSPAGLPTSGLAGALRSLFPEWADRLPPAPEPLPDATATRHRLYRALAEVLECLDTSPLVVEDAHWADEATLEFMLFLATRRPQSVSVLVTYRPEDVVDGSLLRRLSRLAAGASGLRLTLGPLSVMETASLVSSMLAGQHVSGEFAAFLHEHTDGIPLAVEESVRVMAARADLAPAREGGFARRHLADIVVPPTVRDALLERIERLGADARGILQAVAVLAEPSPESVLAEVAGLPTARLFAGLCEAIDCGLLTEEEPGGRQLVSFRHVLAARAIYEAIPAPRQRQLHQRSGEALELIPLTPPARLARHFHEAGDAARWCRYGEQAADLALSAGDEATAETLLHDLVTGAGLPATDMARLIAKAPFAAMAGTARYQELVQALRSVLESGAAGPQDEATVRYQLGRVLIVMGEFAAGSAELERAVPHLTDNPAAAARAMILLGWPHMTGCPAAVNLHWLRRAAQVTAPLAPADRICLSIDRATALLMLGEEEGWAEADKLPGDAPTSAERLQISRGYLNTGQVAMIWGRYTEAGHRLARALELAEAHHYTQYHGLISAARARLDWLTGAWDGLGDRATALAADEDVPSMARLEAFMVTGLLQAARGDHAEAEEPLRRVAEETRQRGAVEYTESNAALVRLMLADGRVEDALRVTDALADAVTGKQVWVWAADIVVARVSALLAAERADEASDLVAEFRHGLHGLAAPAPHAALITCGAVLAQARGKYDRAVTLFARAAAAWQALPRPHDALLAREGQGRCLIAAGARAEGLSLLADVLSGLARLTATTDADRVARCLREHGADTRHVWRGGRRGYGDKLSPRELEIVRLVAQGQTNREIAASLFVSPRTVAYHLDSARRKLNVHTRAGLVTTALAAGFVSGSGQPATR